MPLIEVIRGKNTDDRAVATIFELSKKLGKYPVVVKDGPGFLVNRLLVPYLNESMYLLNDGASIPETDRALLNFGMPMGPVELIDEVGVDVGAKVLHILHEAFGERMRPAPLADKATDEKRLGKKVGIGMYVYSDEGKKKVLDPKIYSILGVKPKPGSISEVEIIERCVLPMINEASRCLAESIVASPTQVDLAMIMGVGFPPFRGGLLRYADTLGIDRIIDRLKFFEKRFGSRFEPPPPLLQMASEGRKHFYG